MYGAQTLYLNIDLRTVVHAIIFMCSTAGFNEVLQEDRGINRLVCFTKLPRYLNKAYAVSS